MNDVDDTRRQFLISGLTAGLYAVGITQPVWAMGRLPKQLEEGKSIYEMEGQVYVNGKLANEKTHIGNNAIIETRDSSYVIFAVGVDAFVLRSNGKLMIKGKQESSIISSMRLIGGKLLSVFGRRSDKQKLKLTTTNVTIGIRGTGVYVESEPERSYVCTCYGSVDLNSNQDKESFEKIDAEHHDMPRYILANAMKGKAIVSAPMINHSDDELAIIEALVGRSVPFSSDYT